MIEMLNGTGSYSDRRDSTFYSWQRKALTATGCLTWRELWLDEVFRALAEEEVEPLRGGLIRAAATATRWVEAIDHADAGGQP